MKPIEFPDGKMGDFKELMCADGQRRLCVYIEAWEVVYEEKPDYEALYKQLKFEVIDYLSHPSIDGSKERLKKREKLKNLVK